MGLFSRRRDDRADERRGPDEDVETAAEAAEDDGAPEHTSTGPWDSDGAPAPSAASARIDMGSLLIPAVDGMQIRVDPTAPGGPLTAAVLILGGSTLELRAFAAPRTAGIWEELRADIVAELQRSGARTQLVDGPHGREVLTQVPVRDEKGQSGTVAARFLGVDGPRWFLRGVLQGRAATDDSAATELRAVFDDVVVVRDQVARPPREILPLHAPGTSAAPEAEDLPGLDPLQPGPTIAEIR